MRTSSLLHRSGMHSAMGLKMVPATRQTIRPTRSLAIKNFNPLGFGSKPQNTRSVSKRKVLARFTDNLDAVSSSQFSLRNGSQMQVSVEEGPKGDQHLRITVSGLKAEQLLLHWGVEGGADYQGGWRLPAQGCWPEGTELFMESALQSPFQVSNDALELVISLPPEEASDTLTFVLKDNATNSWWDCDGSNFTVPLLRSAKTSLAGAETVKSIGFNPVDYLMGSLTGSLTPPATAPTAPTVPTAKPVSFLVDKFAICDDTKWRRVYELGNGSQLLAVVRHPSPEEAVRIDVITDLASSMVLHWGVMEHGKRNWSMPPEEFWPEDTQVAGHVAVENKFLDCDDDECDVDISSAEVPLQRMTISIPSDHMLGALTFVLRSKDHTMWYKDAADNFLVPLPSKQRPHIDLSLFDPCAAFEDELSKIIVECEVKYDMWTLMHRYNKASDLINETLNGYFEMDSADAMARIYIWLRYSSNRHLTWQRNYNTQPRILSAAQDRLTHTIADAHARTSGEGQGWVRAMLGTCGRGGDGQAIRDEILNIMHRNHIPETRGNWMEEWHQKLHNNTTPDDVPICEAYLAFLESNGNRDCYWHVLSDNGISRHRLESFDRPITLEPDFFGDKKDTLIHDFRNYLAILKSVHSGADLQASVQAAGDRIPGDAWGSLNHVMSNLSSSDLLPLMCAAVDVRRHLAPCLTGNRELLYLDLALEDKIRQIAERCVGSAGFLAAACMQPLLHNLVLSSSHNEEATFCLKTWQQLPDTIKHGGRPSKEDALKAVAVINRVRRAISDISDQTIDCIGDVSRSYGRAFEVEDWAYELFAEEVVRGGPAFAVSLVISSVEPTLRNTAQLGDWQVISPYEAIGVVEVVSNLSGVQDKVYEIPTILVAEHVSGEEEVPEGVVAVLTPDAPDMLSHVSVRARNMKVLFATCHDPSPLEDIKACEGERMHFSTTASGSVTWTKAKTLEEGAHEDMAGSSKPKGLKIVVPKWSGRWVVPLGEYKDGLVGAKSKNLQKMQGQLPAGINLPSSVTLPFGCFEKVLEMSENASIKSELKDLVGRLVGKPPNAAGRAWSALSAFMGGHEKPNEPLAPAADVLRKCRELAVQVTVPLVIRKELEKAMATAGIPVPESEARWLQAEAALKGVWASKYNDRAYYSMRKAGLNFDDVRMAVLVQRVVPAQYAFVIHTKNPSNNDENEVFCEMVRGLGESLVSGMDAGSAIAFKATKDALDQPELLCYASKSEAMYVTESLIFRSDSNGEDLEGYAGAGLYESITMDTTVTQRIDYMDDQLVKDEVYRRELLSRICRLGADIETALGSAQDIEGVVEANGSITVVQTRPQV